MTKKWALQVDPTLCINCHNCVIATKDERVGNVFPGYSEPQPAEGLDLIRIERKTRGAGSRLKVDYIPQLCNHCDEAPCIDRGEGAIRKRPDGIVVIDIERARGNQSLVEACPYGMLKWNPEASVIENWNFDAHLLDQGWKEPRCTQACPTKALQVLHLTDEALADHVSKNALTPFPDRQGSRPRVYYRNTKEIFGAVLTGNLVIGPQSRPQNFAGATVKLEEADSGVFSSATTNTFGDFEFTGLPKCGSAFTLTVQRGERWITIASGHRDADLDVGTLHVDD